MLARLLKISQSTVRKWRKRTDRQDASHIPKQLNTTLSVEQEYAVVQLRQDNLAATLYNMVGFQTNLRWGDQERVFKMIPGLENAEFVRFGQMHRNTYIHSPSLLCPTMAFRGTPGPGTWYFAGQITGVEGYVGSVGSGDGVVQRVRRRLIGFTNTGRTLLKTGRRRLALGFARPGQATDSPVAAPC